MNCAQCGKTATKLNAQGFPTCSAHAQAKMKGPSCPNCGIEMSIRKSKYGLFWGCQAFPMCDGTKKI